MERAGMPHSLRDLLEEFLRFDAQSLSGVFDQRHLQQRVVVVQVQHTDNNRDCRKNKQPRGLIADSPFRRALRVSAQHSAPGLGSLSLCCGDRSRAPGSQTAHVPVKIRVAGIGERGRPERMKPTLS